MMNASRSMSLELHYGAGIDGRYQRLHADASTNWADQDPERAAMGVAAWNPQWHIYPGLPPSACEGAGLHGKSTRLRRGYGI